MRHWVRGALGAAMVYPLVWHYSAPGPRLPAAGVSGPQGAKPVRTAATVPPNSLTYEPEAPERRAVSRNGKERRAVATKAAAEPAPPQLPTVEDPNVPLPVMPELKEVISRAAEVQQYAANPGELDQRVQTLEEDPAKLAKLRALAEMFVQLPAPREESYLPSSTRAQSSAR